MTNFLSYAQVRMLRAESQFANQIVRKGGLLSFPRTGSALQRCDEITTKTASVTPGRSLKGFQTSFSYGHSKGEVFNFFGMSKGVAVGEKKSDVLQGTLDLMVLKTLHAIGPLHGFGIARRIEQLSEDVLQLNEGTVYTSLLRLQQQSWIKSEWGISDNNRKARFYSITRLGKKQLDLETENWERIAGVIGRVLRLERQG
jgi:PadR family transcriptional regulator PadR